MHVHCLPVSVHQMCGQLQLVSWHWSKAMAFQWAAMSQLAAPVSSTLLRMALSVCTLAMKLCLSLCLRSHHSMLLVIYCANYNCSTHRVALFALKTIPTAELVFYAPIKLYSQSWQQFIACAHCRPFRWSTARLYCRHSTQHSLARLQPLLLTVLSRLLTVCCILVDAASHPHLVSIPIGATWENHTAMQTL